MDKMKKPIPNQNEIPIQLGEMFFSTTDHRGVILDGNDVFIRISKYSPEEIIGAPHNIVRHPDMPKIVFKIFWDAILAGKTICAYVKNLTKDGSYYWVFATVIPIGDSFLSIRMKPTSQFKEIVEGLYKELLSIEKSSGIDSSLKALTSALNSLGFADYESFVLAAISAELSSRFALQANDSKELQSTGNIRESLFKMFNIVNNLSNHTKSISEQITKVGATSKNIEFAALNTIIEAERLGNTGKALAVIAQHISSSAIHAKNLNSGINSLATKMLEVFHSTQMSVALSTLQIEMLSCFIMQLNEAPLSMSEEGFRKNTSMLTTQIEESLNTTRSVIQSLDEDIDHISSELTKTSQVLMTLEFIQKAGLIESARLSDGSIFYHLFLTIKDLIKESKIVYSDFSEINNILKRSVNDAVNEYNKASMLWHECTLSVETTCLKLQQDQQACI